MHYKWFEKLKKMFHNGLENIMANYARERKSVPLARIFIKIEKSKYDQLDLVPVIERNHQIPTSMVTTIPHVLNIPSSRNLRMTCQQCQEGEFSQWHL